MNKYFATRSINRPWNIGDTRTLIYCDNNRESIATVHKRFPDAMPVTREHALQLVRQERSIYRNHYRVSNHGLYIPLLVGDGTSY